MMRKLLKLLAKLTATVLVVASIQGCVQSDFAKKGFGKHDECLFCHGPNAQSGVRDFSYIYNNPRSHHPVGVTYPLGTASRPDFKQPNAYVRDVLFFDDEGYGELDNDDVRLFGYGNNVKVECASCHREHGEATGEGSEISEHYLRFANEGSRLCVTCHQK